MAELKRQRKVDLIELAKELGIAVDSTNTIIEIITKITSTNEYDEELAIAQVRNIKEDRESRAAQITAQEVRENEERERERERQHELAKLQAGQNADIISVGSSREDNVRNISLKTLMKPFDEEKSEITLFLALFEKQAKKAKIDQSDWVFQLLSLLPMQLAEGIMRLKEDEVEDYERVKEHLLERFRVNAETYRTKFMQASKGHMSLWKDLVFELRTYLSGWLAEAEIDTFEKLQDLMIADQIKRRASQEMKEKFLDTWSKLVNPEVVASKFDEFESVRKTFKKTFPKNNGDEKRGDKYYKNESFKERKLSDKKLVNWRERSDNDSKEREKLFEKRRQLTCYHCNSPSHLRPSCPLLKRDKVHPINHLGSEIGLDSSFEPYLSLALVNGKEISVLRDSGSKLDVISRKLINSDQLNGEFTWVKQPLENEVRCLPLANVSLEIPEIGLVKTKAAVVNPEVDLKFYILGNETNAIIENQKLNPNPVNVVMTRSKAKENEANLMEKSINHSLLSKEEQNSSPLAEIVDEGEADLPPGDREFEVSLAKVNRETFLEEQKLDTGLKGLWDKAKSGKSEEYVIENEMLFRVTKEKHGERRKQLVIPCKYREEILKLCHETVGSHMGLNKCKNKLFRYYFWPNIVKNVEDFIKSCDPCQRIDKGNEIKKVPMKLVPIISEIFTRLNCDLVGPLPESERGNRYMLTAICMASKYPEAIPLLDTKSESVIDGLLIIFSRLGFPREVQCDLGTCFTSILTNTFFEKFGIKVIHSSVHRPQSNPVERWHRSVKRLLKVLCIENGKSWEKNLPHALLALRSVTHESIGFSPAEIVHGKNLRVPETLIFEKWAKVTEEESPVTEYIFTLINRLKHCQDLAAEQMEASREKRKTWYDKGAVERSFKPGDKVLVMNTARPNKLSVNWIGPGTIESKLSETNYIVSVPGRREKSQIYHINLLKPYHQRVEHINVLMSNKLSPEILEADLDIPYLNASSEVYDFNEIVRESDLGKKCSPEQIEELGKVLGKHRQVFSNDPGRTDLIEHDIELISEQPFRIKPYRTSPRQTEIIKQEIKRMLDLNIIEVAESDFVSPLILVEVPGREPRPCVDYRKLNSLTRTEYFPLPHIEERVELVAGAKYITLIDLTKGYWQILLTPRAQRYSTFATTFGTFRALVMGFGLLNAS